MKWGIVKHLVCVGFVLGFLSRGYAAVEAQPFVWTFESHKTIYMANSWFLENGGNDRGYRNEEIIVQFSFRKNLYDAFYFGYTQKFFWQLFDHNNSHPIRESNYNPEFFLDYNNVFNLNLFRIGVWEHESNGQDEGHDENGRDINTSRTWNRYYIHVFKEFQEGLWGTDLKVWGIYDRKDSDYGSFYDDNRDIEHYLGMAELSFFIKYENFRSDMMFRRGWKKGTETFRLTTHYPIYVLFGKPDNGVSLFTYYFSGYGESLIDYNERSHRVGIGISIH